MRRALLLVLALGILAGGAVLWITRPARVDPADYAALTGDPERGRAVFDAAGCASCHLPAGTPEGAAAEGGDAPVLAGGQRFASDFGTFVAPNITPDPEAGIGHWSLADLASALTRGTDRAGRHLYPALPYASYVHATPQDIADLYEYLMTLPPDPTPNQPSEVRFPFSIRAGLGVWKMLNLKDSWAVPGDLPPEAARGRYLAEALGHCAECHTPRDALGGLDRDRWLSGVPGPDGRGGVPNITPGALDWSEAEIAEYLSSGFTPDYDSAGGEMAKVVSNFAKLPEADRLAVAAYLKTVPAIE
ncbi:cytochrome c [Frigidibacter sp. MR17.14]|uniref:c-type cytochrome n=1 Tax=Frigidibacter sp. MR17.14 TaxID=3126509 RepID=UPI003012BECD